MVCSFPPASYRRASEIQEVRKDRDAIKTVRSYALEGNLATEEELKVLAVAIACSQYSELWGGGASRLGRAMHWREILPQRRS